MPNVKAVIEYDGADFFGYQVQPGMRTIQGEIEGCLARISGGADAEITAAGRTDAGVHATGQVISFRSNSGIPVANICGAMNNILPGDIAFKSAETVNDEFDARRSALGRTYIYLIYNNSKMPVRYSRYMLNVRHTLDDRRMDEASNSLEGIHDFASFGSAMYPGGSTVRTMFDVTVRRRGHVILIKYHANAFLRTMVRSITGALIAIGAGWKEPSELENMLALRKRDAAVLTAPPQGLYLTRVHY